MRTNWRTQISSRPDVHHGEPCINGTRIPVSVIIGSLADGMSPTELAAEYPQLTLDAIYSALAYAADSVRHEVVVSLAA